MLSSVLPLVMAALPVVYEVDFGALPGANVAPKYKYTLVWSFEGLPNFPLTSTVGLDTGPTEEANYFAKWSQDDPAWKLKRTGNRIAFYACGEVRVTGIAVIGDGPKPLVRRVIAIPPEKKK